LVIRRWPEQESGAARPEERRSIKMLAVVLFFLLVLVLFGLGFAVKALFWVALVLFVIWVIGIIFGRMRGSRWYW
jgi:hypothetical protein